jgi:hypothetical protein
MNMTHILAVIVRVIMAETETETETGTGTGTRTADVNMNVTATVVAGNEVETGIGIGIEVGTMLNTGSGYASADLLANSTLRDTMTQRWASARAGGGKSR